MGCGSSVPTKPPADKRTLARENTMVSVRTDAQGKKVAYNSYEEWQRKNAAKKLIAALKTDEGRNELKALYESLDTDGDGKLTSEEWSSGISQNTHLLSKYFGGSLPAEDFTEVFIKIDSDGNGSLTWEEFVVGAIKSIQID